MDANVNKYDKDPEFGLALRILYSALVQDAPGAYSFHEFWLSWTKHAVPSPVYIDLQLAIDACMLAFSELTPRRTGMLLLIDETRKLAGSFRVRSGVGINDETNGVYDMLGVVGSALDSNCSAVFNVAVTTLDSLMLRAVSTNSGRRIDWVGLDGLRQPAAEAMIMGALGHSASGVPVPALVSLSIADCARHPRTLETLSQVLLLRSVEQNGAPGWFRNFGELKRTRQAVTKRLGTSESSPLWAVRAALNGVPLPYTAEIDGSGGTSFSTAIAAGVFLNTLEADSTGSRVDVPRLSFMHLLRAVDELPVAVCDAIVGLASGEESCLDAHLSKSPFGGAGFEDFVLGWLKLRFGLAAATGSPQGLSLEELFVLKVDSNLPTAVRKTLCCRMMAGSTTRTDPTQFLIRTIPSDSFANAVNNARSRSKISEVVAAGCGAVTFIANNPAFDILLLVHEVATGSLVAGAAAPPLHAVAIEARFSSPTSKVRTTAENIKGKVKLFREQLGPGGAFAALGIPADRVTYVVMASRLDQRQQQQRTPPGSSRPPPSKRGLTGDEKTALLAQGVVVLDREGVARALTPTLVDRAYFLMQPQKPV